MTHDKLVEIANEIFAALKRRRGLMTMDEATLATQPYPENDHAEMMDFVKDMGRVVAIEAQGIGSAGNADCFAIADVLLRAVDRQWRGDDHRTR